ncbi:MAG: cation diffusion facilitator family transporter [Bacteroidota bacterium]
MNTSSAIREKQVVALSSVAAAIFLTGVKLTVGLKTNSLGILSEAAHSGLDLIAALITYFAVTLADRPPDLDHQYGHGKIENVSALIETILLVLTCVWIIMEAVKRLITHESHIEVSYYSYGIMILAIIIDLSRSRVLSRVAKKHHSQALEADALHFSSDVWTSLVVILGLFCVSQGYPVVDAIAAVMVAILILFVSYRMGRRTIDVLVDRVPPGLYQKIIESIKHVEGVEEVRNVRLRSSGSKVFVETAVGIRRTMPFENMHDVVNVVREKIGLTHPNIDVVVHAAPVETGDESIAEKVRMLVLKKGLRTPHNLEVHNTHGEYYLDFDIEFPQSVMFQKAHEITLEIEKDIRNTIPSIREITIHLEEIHSQETELMNATDLERAMREAIRQKILADTDVIDCPTLTLLKWDSNYNVSIICGIDKSFTLGRVHQIVTRVETNLYAQFPELHRVTIQAEPR